MTKRQVRENHSKWAILAKLSTSPSKAALSKIYCHMLSKYNFDLERKKHDDTDVLGCRGKVSILCHSPQKSRPTQAINPVSHHIRISRERSLQYHCNMQQQSSQTQFVHEPRTSPG